MRKVIAIIVNCFFSYVSLFAQTNGESGYQPVINYSPKEYGAEFQNWAIMQGKNGIMYFGNSDGLLEFDGTDWRLYPLPNKYPVRSLANGDSAKIYVGSISDLGYFLPDSSGRLIFHSLLKFIPNDKRDFEDVWTTFANSNRIYFQTSSYIFIWDIPKQTFKIVENKNSNQFAFMVNGKLYVREFKKGLEVLNGDFLTFVKGGEKFADEPILGMLPFPGKAGTILIVTRTMGLFKYDGTNFIPFKTEADSFIKEYVPYLHGTILSDGNIALGTLNGGSVVIDTSGKEVRIYNTENGIINNSIKYTFQDAAGAVWLATSNGISRISYSLPISYFDSRNNFSTISNDIIRHDGTIYVAADDGVHYLDPATSSFHLLNNSDVQSWSFAEVGNELLVGSNDGLFKVEKNALSAIRKATGYDYYITILKRSQLNPNKLYLGTKQGLRSILKAGDSWIDEEQVLNTISDVVGLTEDRDGTLWVGTVSSGVFRVTPQRDSKGNVILSKPLIEHFDRSNGLQEGMVLIKKLNGLNYFLTSDSLYKFDEKKKLFYSDTSDSICSAFYQLNDNDGVYAIEQDYSGRIWMSNKNKLIMGKLRTDGSYDWISAPFNGFANETIIKVYAENNGVVWFGTTSPIVKYTIANKNPEHVAFFALVREVQTGEDSTIYFGGETSTLASPQISYKNNSIKFKYAATSYEGRNTNKFKTILEGFDGSWSSLSTENTKQYTNLPPGKYTFKVMAENIFEEESKTAIYSFEILPPWYRTWWAYSLFALSFFGIVYVAVQFRSRHLKAANLALEEKISQRTAELKQSLQELKATQAQLIQSEKMASLGELTAGIAHEIQNPLNFVNNFSEVNEELIEELQGERSKVSSERDDALQDEIINDLKQNLEKINHHGKRADAIVKGMLQHSRVSTGQKEPTDINALCDEYLRLAYHGLKAKDKDFNVELKTDFDSSTGKINIIPQDIGRVLLNLYNNAFYAVKPPNPLNGEQWQPLVSVTTRKISPLQGTGAKIEIMVSDNGNGIPQNIVDKIFQPFFTTKPTGQGTGLGLSLAYDIIKAHNGEIRVNTKEGEGSEFIIQLPRL
jgi:signal transduction histidine kinase